MSDVIGATTIQEYCVSWETPATIGSVLIVCVSIWVERSPVVAGAHDDVGAHDVGAYDVEELKEKLQGEQDYDPMWEYHEM